MIETFLRDLRQPEYIYVFTNSFRDFRCAYARETFSDKFGHWNYVILRD